MKPGIYENIPMEEYKAIEAVHKSMFPHILKSGKQFEYFTKHGEETKDHMAFGNLVDCLLFEPHLCHQKFRIPPQNYYSVTGTKKKTSKIKPWNWSADYCKEWGYEIERVEPGISFTTREDYKKAQLIVSSIQSHPQAQKWLHKALYQLTMIWIDPETGLLCKARADAFNEEVMSDLKITYSPYPGPFAKTLANFKYFAQGAFYHDGYFLSMDMPLPESCTIPFGFIVAQDHEPFEVICYTLGPESFEAGRILYRQALDKYLEYRETDEYPGYSYVAEEIEMPQWALNKIMLEGRVE